MYEQNENPWNDSQNQQNQQNQNQQNQNQNQRRNRRRKRNPKILSELVLHLAVLSVAGGNRRIRNK